MARRYTNHDHYCVKCGKRIEDGEDYIVCGRNLEFCEECSEEMCADCDHYKPKTDKQ